MEHFRRVQLREVKLFSLAVVRELAPDLARCGRILWAHEDPMRTHAYKRPHGSASEAVWSAQVYRAEYDDEVPKLKCPVSALRVNGRGRRVFLSGLSPDLSRWPSA
jgi:hypothetical protein